MIDKLQSWSIRTHLILLLALLALPCAVVLVYTGVKTRDEAVEAAKKECLAFVRTVASEQQALVAGAHELAAALSLLPEVQSLNAKKTTVLFSGLLKHSRLYANIIVADKSGAVWASAVPFKEGFFIGDRWYFREAVRTGEFSSGEYIIGRTTGKRIIPFGYPVKNASGDLVSVIGVIPDLDFAEQAFERMNHAPKTFFTLYDRYGIAVIKYPRDTLGQSLIGRPDIRKEAFMKIQTGPEEGTFESLGNDDRIRLFAYKRVSLPHESKPYLYIRASVPRSVVASKANIPIFRNLALLVTVFGVGMFLIWFYGDRVIVNPFMRLKEASERLAEGENVGSVSQTVKGGELGQLARAFDNMAKVLTLREAALRESEGRLRLFIQHAPASLAMFDRDMRYLSYSQRWLRDYNLGERDLTGLSHYEVFPEIQGHWKEVHRQGLAGEVIKAEEDRFERADGSVQWLRWEVRPWHDHAGRVGGIVIFSEDITDRKHAEETLKEREETLRTTFDAVHESMLFIDKDGIIRLCNKVGAERFHKSIAELVGTNVFGHLPPDVARHRKELFDKVIATGEPAFLEDTRSGKSLESYVYPVFDKEGNASGITIFSHDVTEEMRGRLEKETTLALLKLLNDQSQTRELIRALTGYLQEWTGCEAVGIRLRDGDDFPYYETRGFPAEFVEAESSLCARDLDGQILRDDMGNPVLDCMCGNILSGRFDPSLPFFTRGGSFWSNCTTDLLASSTEEDRQARTRNRCNSEGYESVALIPLRHRGEILGLLQLNDHAKGRFTPELITFLESTCEQIAIALAQRKAQAALRASEERFRDVSEAAGEYVFELDLEGCLTFISERVEDVLGYSPGEMLGKTPFDFLPPSEVSRTLPIFREHVEARTGFRDLEHQAITKSGRPIWLSANVVPIFGSEGVFLGYRGTAMDITERREADRVIRESEERYRTLFENMVHGVFYQRADGVLVDVNPAALDILGLTRDEFEGKTSTDPYWKVIDEEGIEIPGERYPSMVALRTGEPVRNAVLGVFNARKQSFVWVNVNAIPQFLPGGASPHQVFVTLYDITERREAARQVMSSLREKEVLLKEVHHRVKNNMQVISSLLNMQSQYLRDQEDVEAFRASMDRIKSMALIHDKLYRSGTLASISLPGYVSDLASELVSTYAVHNKVEIDLDISPLSLGIDDAVPVGLIINELISNSLKHAFPEDAPGTIRVRAEAKDREIALTVSDNGIGFPEDMDFMNTPSLGMQLVVTLVEQLEGTIELKREKGTEFRITFEAGE